MITLKHLIWAIVLVVLACYALPAIDGMQRDVFRIIGDAQSTFSDGARIVGDPDLNELLKP